MPKGRLTDTTSAGPARSSRDRRWLSIKLLVGLALLAFVGTRVDLRTVSDQIGKLSSGPVVLSLAVFAASILLHAYRWSLVLRFLRIGLSYLDTVRLIVAGNFLNLFLPGNLGGDLYRILGTRHRAASLVQATGVVVLERYAGFLATFLMAVGAIVFTDYSEEQPYVAVAVVGSLVAFLLPLLLGMRKGSAARIMAGLEKLRAERAARLMDRLSRALRRLARQPRLLLGLLALSAAMKACVALILHLLALGLGIEVSWIILLVFLPIHTVVSALPISLNGLGVREANLVGFFTLSGLTPEQAASLAFLHLIWIYGTALPGGLLLLVSESPGGRSSGRSRRDV